MSWAAANAPKTTKDRLEDAGGIPAKKRSTETVEAALSRLTKAYTSSMECIGSLQQTNRMLQNDPSKITDASRSVLQRVANAARSTFEHAILFDPLVVPHIPTLHETMLCFLERNDSSTERWRKVTQYVRPEPPVLTSVAHKTTIRELAYLTLLNYSDLLQMCCRTDQSKASTKTLLERGVITKIQTLQHNGHCCWEGESQEDTQRLAVTALCDASKLDGSDPVLWLKLACASRDLERMLQLTTAERSRHRRLQRYALEQGSQALPPTLPPNRAVQRAYRELLAEPEPHVYESSSTTVSSHPVKLVLDLPRYSWSVLGRMLLRVAREGTEFHNGHKHHRPYPYPTPIRSSQATHFGSPTIDMRLSPTLILPVRVLGRICLFLDGMSIRRFESTCRALAVSIMSARAVMEDEMQKATDNTQETVPDSLLKRDVEGMEGTNKAEESTRIVIKKKSQENTATEKGHSKSSREHSRSSQRLRSQQINTGKKTERLGKRQSFEYCFLAATTGCSAEDHKAALDDAKTDESIRRLLPGNDRSTALRMDQQRFAGLTGGRRRESLAPITDSSLASFVDRWSARNSGPMDLMTKYLEHVAMNVEDVFASDPGGTVALTSCILSCFEALLRRSGYIEHLVPVFYEDLAQTGNFSRSLESFTLDVLHGELMLKQCDRRIPMDFAYEDDSNMIGILLPQIYQAYNELENFSLQADHSLDNSMRRHFTMVKIRCNWLLAGFYLWRSRIAQTVWEAQRAEAEGTSFIEACIKAFESPHMNIGALQTPQLVSPGRTEPHWRELSQACLRKYRDEIQASTVVSVVREKFHDLIVKINQRRSDDDESRVQLTAADSIALAETGERLYERYSPQGADSESKHFELIEDFLAGHGNALTARADDTSRRAEDATLATLLPVEQVNASLLQRLSSPCNLTMLVVCMMVEAANRARLLQLLVRLVAETRKMHRDLLQRISSSRRLDGDSDGFSDSDSDSVMSGDSDGRGVSNKNIDERRALQCGHLVAYLIERIEQCLSKASDDAQYTFALSDECSELVEAALEMSSEWFESTSKQLLQEDTADLCIFRSVQMLVGRLFIGLSAARDHQQSLDVTYLGALSRMTIAHQHLFSGLVVNHGNRSSRVAKQRLCVQRAEYIGAVASEVGLILSRYLCTVEDRVLLPSSVLLKKCSLAGTRAGGLSNDELKYLIDSTLWLWKFSSQSLAESQVSEIPVCGSFDRPLVKALRVPVASLVVGLCGSAAGSRDIDFALEGNGDSLCLSEFYDTDDSANEWQSSEDETSATDCKLRELLRVACHVVQCVNLVLDKIDDKSSLSLVPVSRCVGLGPLLPLVASRVLNFFANTILSTFSDYDKDVPDLWAPQYPVTARTIGEILDSNLYKVYRWMYGFVLVGEKCHLQNCGKDLAASVATMTDLAATDCRLENLSAAACLYRCMVRAYSSGRRSLPKKALELVSAALPALEESQKSRTIRNFIFGDAGSYFSMEQVKRIVKGGGNGWDTVISSIRDQLIVTDSEPERDETKDTSDDTEVAMRIRRGILSQLSDGVIPSNTTENPKSKSEQFQDDDRAVTMKTEEEIGKKFDAILDAICLGDARTSGSWYRAARCLSAKAELIADRLGRNQDFAVNQYFSIPQPRHRTVRGIELASLLKDQEDTDSLNNANWIPYLGNDLSAYARYTWASHESLRTCSEIVGEHCNSLTDGTENEQRRQYQLWKHIDAQYRAGDILAWQEAWGGMFVFALRKISVRLMAVALYLLQSKENQNAEDKVLMSELCESLGVIFYSDLSGSHCYGYPMRRLGEKRKRDLAMTAKACFEVAVHYVNEPEKTDGGSEEAHTTWDLMFILGKCDEKIASTYILEAFPNEGGHTEMVRLYEQYIATALNHYAAALAQVKKIEEDGGAIVDQSGGSAHGRTEIEYRILAVRLKCLIASAVREECEFDQAEEEALRLAGCHWFREPEDLSSWKEEHVRNRVWTILADVVAGLVQCRVNHPFFHRSVYRHAQALMWAPVLCDPTSAEGSQGSVPTTQSVLIKGLNNSTSVSQSAESVIGSLFDKKRLQLCAVWVTPTSPSSPFQTVNTSIRKYDSLRGKYVSAFIECLRLSRRRAKLETFLKWLASSPRDVVGYFQASARANGSQPPKSHMNDPLLIFNNSSSGYSLMTAIKRQTNSAFADVLLHEMSERQGKKIPTDENKLAETDLKFAYATYLRLNCSKEDLSLIKAWSYNKYHVREVEALCHAYLCLGTKAAPDNGIHGGKADFGDWTGGGRKAAIFEKALSKCKELFPNLTPNFFSKKASASSKSKKGGDDGDEGDFRNPTPANIDSKRNDSSAVGTSGGGEMVTKSFEVVVPAGLAPGQSFLTAINVGGTKKQFRLTVPETKPSTLRFKTQIPRSSVSDAPAPKKARTESPTLGNDRLEYSPPATTQLLDRDVSDKL